MLKEKVNVRHRMRSEDIFCLFKNRDNSRHPSEYKAKNIPSDQKNKNGKKSGKPNNRPKTIQKKELGDALSFTIPNHVPSVSHIHKGERTLYAISASEKKESVTGNPIAESTMGCPSQVCNTPED